MKKKMELGLTLVFVFIFGVASIWAGGKSEQTSGAIPGDKNPFGKYNPPITVKSTLMLSSGFNYEPGDSLDNNPWTRKYHDDLGVDFKWSWVASLEDEYNQKMAASIASGDLPDIFAVRDAQQYAMLIRSGLIWDLTDVFEDYASDYLKEMMQNVPEQREICSYQGRLYSIPYFGSKIATSVLYVRQDWIDKLGLPNPDSIQNLIKIADAFKNRDPDGNGRNDTIGLLVNQALWPIQNIGGLAEFFAAYHAYPNDGWIKDRSGNLVPGVIQPEVKSALASLAEMYKAGLIDREFINVDFNRATEAVTSGRAGLFYGLFSMCQV